MTVNGGSISGWIIMCLLMAALFLTLAAVFAARKGKAADLVAGFNSLTDSQKARYDREAIARDYRDWMRLMGEVYLLGAALAHWLGWIAFTLATAAMLISCGTQMHIDWEKAFEKYKIDQ